MTRTIQIPPSQPSTFGIYFFNFYGLQMVRYVQKNKKIPKKPITFFKIANAHDAEETVELDSSLVL